MVPKIPLGPYPQPELCDQLGRDPINIKTRMTMIIVVSMSSPVYAYLTGQIN
jgi:hypothetical protein